MNLENPMSEEAQREYETQLGQTVSLAREQVAKQRAKTSLAELVKAVRSKPKHPCLSLFAHPEAFFLFDVISERVLDEAALISTSSGEVEIKLPTPDKHGYIREAGEVFIIDKGGETKYCKRYLGEWAADGSILIRGDVIVDPWQIWQAKALGFSAVELTIGAQVTPDLTALIRVCHEVGLEWILKAHTTMEIREGIAAYQDAFVPQPPVIALGLDLNGQPIEQADLAGIVADSPLPDNGFYLGYFRKQGAIFDIGRYGGPHPSAKAYQEAGLHGAIGIDPFVRRLS